MSLSDWSSSGEAAVTSLDGERAAKLDAMVAAGERSRPLYDAVPDTVARLETLQGRHVQVRIQEAECQQRRRQRLLQLCSP